MCTTCGWGLDSNSCRLVIFLHKSTTAERLWLWWSFWGWRISMYADGNIFAISDNLSQLITAWNCQFDPIQSQTNLAGVLSQSLRVVASGFRSNYFKKQNDRKLVTIILVVSDAVLNSQENCEAGCCCNKTSIWSYCLVWRMQVYILRKCSIKVFP